MKKLKVMTVVGTNEEIIRLSAVIEKLEDRSDWSCFSSYWPKLWLWVKWGVFKDLI